MFITSFFRNFLEQPASKNKYQPVSPSANFDNEFHLQ